MEGLLTLCRVEAENMNTAKKYEDRLLNYTKDKKKGF